MTDTDRAPAPVPLPDSAGWMAKEAREAALAASILPGNKAVIFDLLTAASIVSVTVTFDGYGDSGQIENVEAKVSNDIVAELPTSEIEIAVVDWGDNAPRLIKATAADALEHLAYYFLGVTHCGWENSDGAYGEFVFDVAARTITLDYNERYTSSESYSHEW